MLVDTHCHINTMIKKEFDVPLSSEALPEAKQIIEDTAAQGVGYIINVGTSLIESKNCIMIAQLAPQVYASVGIHPNDATSSWRADFKEIETLVAHKETNKIVAIGECGLDKHYPSYDIQRQKDAFKAQIELALENNLALIVHTRDAADETLRALEEFKGQIERGIIHCFSEDAFFAKTAIEWGLVIGIGGTITYPKNLHLRDIIATIDLDKLVLETDAPFLPPQRIRGQQNHPCYIKEIAEYIAQLRAEPFELIAQKTTATALRIFEINMQTKKGNMFN